MAEGSKTVKVDVEVTLTNMQANAVQLHEVFDTYVQAGFTREESMQIIFFMLGQFGNA